MPRQAAAAQGFAVDNSTRELLKPTADLNERERAEFANVVLGSPPSHFLPADVATISAYARAVVAERRAAGELDAAPVIDGKPSPWLPVWLGQLRACTTLARRLNIGPCGRVATASKVDEVPVSFVTRASMEARRDDEPN
ncbi:hypothetical protein JQ625_28260 [Bradyrhizobium diazoefficiens]|nr:hypothetical protein [Bradyrhizobium diazoefficiens]MBR0778739.1 hypothetical protein [Bradyrhizobium diazoefficiens]